MTGPIAAVERVRDAVKTKKLSPSAGDNLTRWLTLPQYEIYQGRLAGMVEAGRFEELDLLFWEVIPFGTGGRRGAMSEFGSATINERTIAESADGMARYLQKTQGGKPGGTAVIAHDTRNRSREFAELTACIFAARGLTVFLFDAHRSTPELSFAVRFLKCNIGVMISASHNPPSDNGFKAYWSDGAQVLPPHDVGIIECVYESGHIPKADLAEAKKAGQIELVGDAIDKAFLETLMKHSLSDQRQIHGLFTPLHGVGGTSVFPLLQQAGFDGFTMFEPQSKPDGNFPNVPDHLPNPERPEVFLPAIEEARNSGAELILASDPDADRLGVVVRTTEGQFVPLSGNQVGALLTDYILRKRAASGTIPQGGYIVETLVTTPLIEAIGKSFDVKVISDLLVGFKYIAQTMEQLGPTKFLFGAEESLGYLTGEYCRDKDASIAALYVAELAAELKVEEKTLVDRLNEIYVEQGAYYWEGQISHACKGPTGQEQMLGLLNAFRKTPPKSWGDGVLTKVHDYAKGINEIRELPANKKVADLPQPVSNLLIFEAEGAGCQFKVAVRPSGTEPKIKFYLFTKSACDKLENLPTVRQQAAKATESLKVGLQNWIEAQLPKAT
jgi:phosphoglucomutase/phosphomannomutase